MSEGIFWREYLDQGDFTQGGWKKKCNSKLTLCGLHDLIYFCLQDYHLMAMFCVAVGNDEMVTLLCDSV